MKNLSEWIKNFRKLWQDFSTQVQTAAVDALWDAKNAEQVVLKLMFCKHGKERRGVVMLPDLKEGEGYKENMNTSSIITAE